MLLVILLTLIIPAIPATPVRAASHCVNPGGTGGCFASIQAAVNASAPGDTVTVAAGTYNELITISASLTLIGADPSTTFLDRANAPGDTTPVITISSGTVALSGFTVRNSVRDGIFNSGQTTVANVMLTGLGISGIANRAGGTLILQNSVVHDNGAGVDNGGQMVTINNCTIQHNRGMGIYNRGQMTVTNTTVAFNGYTSTAFSNAAGGIQNGGPMTLTNSAVIGNSSPVGAGIWNLPLTTLTVVNTTISGNSAPPRNPNDPQPLGPGILDWGTLTLIHVTMSNNNNPSAQGPEALCVCAGASSSAMIYSSVFSNPLGGDCGANGGTITSGDYNVIVSGCFLTPQAHDLITDPKLGPLQNNGGPTLTQALLAGSPAIDRVPGMGSVCPATDQRGVLRPQGAGCDSGAYEAVASVTPLPVPKPALPASGDPLPLPAPRSGGSLTPSGVSSSPSPLPPHR